MAFLVGARQRRTRKDILISYLSFPMSLRFYFMSLRGHPKEAAAISPSPFVPTITRRLLRHCVPRKDILILYLSSPMSLRFYFMSLRGHPKEAAAISPSPFVPTITRRLLRRPSAEGLLAMTFTPKRNPPVNGRVSIKLSCLALCAQLLIVDSPISIHPCLRASTTAWVRSLASSLSRIEVTWFLIVCSLMPRTWAICLLE